MNKVYIDLLFLVSGLLYSSLLSDRVYDNTLGYLIENKWIQPPVVDKANPNLLGRKATIAFYSLMLIILGLYLIWNHNI